MKEIINNELFIKTLRSVTGRPLCHVVASATITAMIRNFVNITHRSRLWIYYVTLNTNSVVVGDGIMCLFASYGTIRDSIIIIIYRSNIQPFCSYV